MSVAAALACARAAADRWTKGGARRPSPDGPSGFRDLSAGGIGAPDGKPRSRRVAIGDPQAPLGTVLAILDAHGVLADDGRVRDDTLLVSMGDHFDWGGPMRREESTADGEALLAWLAMHPRDQVVILVGNHDLARVGELAPFDDETFARCRAEADRAYYERTPVRPEAEFRAAYGLPSWEVAARDFASFRTSQRELVAALLDARRLSVAFAPADDLLLSHAGVTKDELEVLRVPEGASAGAIAVALNDLLQAAWGHGDRLIIPSIHTPGTAAGEGSGMFFHRATRASVPELPRRRFHTDRLPRGLVQGIGHVRDQKSRLLLDVAPQDGDDGPLRSLVVRDDELVYARGVVGRAGANEAVVVHLDGGMLHADPAQYELLDLDRRAPFARR